MQGVQPVSVQAASSDASVWDGTTPTSVTSEDWYVETSTMYYIRSAKGLAYFASLVNSTNGYQSFSGATVFLDTDIDLAGFEWTPIGSVGQEFRGTFNAQGNYIYNLTISQEYSAAGFFGSVDGGEIKNVNLRNVDISTSSACVGAVAGKVVSGIIQSSSVQGQINTSTVGSFGGVVGDYAGTTMINVSANINLSSTGIASNSISVGGLVGKASAASFSLLNSFSEGEISAASGYVGGLVGLADPAATISSTYSVANIVASTSNQIYAGGLIGRTNSNIEITHSYMAGDITASGGDSSYYGGLVGFASSSGSISNSMMLGTISASSGIKDNFFNHSTASVSSKNLYTTDSFDEKEIFYTKDFYLDTTKWDSAWGFKSASQSNIWAMSAGVNNSLPYLNLDSVYQRTAANNDSSFTGKIGDNGKRISLRGEGTATSPYLIETAGDLGFVAEMYNVGSASGENYYFSLLSDICLLGKTWQPIGYANAFTGIFDGNGHTISGIVCSLQEQYAYHGLFGKTNNAVIKNLLLEDVRYLNFGSTESPNAKGNLVGYVEGNTYIINCDDNESSETEFSIGSVKEDAQLYVVYGINNLNMNYQLREDVTYSSEISVIKGYETEIASDGGIFYGADKKVYRGAYRLLVGENGELILPAYENGTDTIIIDATYGKTLFPQLSTSWEEEDVLIKRGSKLSKYVYVRDESDASTVNDNKFDLFLDNFDGRKLVSGLKAIWQNGVKHQVKIIYNSYEKANFGITADFNAAYNGALASNGARLEVNSSGEVSATYTLVYDSLLSEKGNTVIYEVPEYQFSGKAHKLRSGDFDIAALHTGFLGSNFSGVEQQLGSFEDKVFVNASLNSLYAEWKGLSDMNNILKHTVTLRFTSSGFKASDAVESVKFKKVQSSDEVSISMLTDLQEEADGSYTATFDYNTLISDKRNNYGQLEFLLKDGYGLGKNIKLGYPSSEDTNVSFEGEFDTNFGNLATSAKSVSYDKFDNVYFYNFVGGAYTIDINLVRENYANILTVSDDLYFGISPKMNLVVTKNADNTYSSNVSIYTDETGSYQWLDILSLTTDNTLKERLYTISQTSVSDDETLNKDTLYVAFDVINNQIVFSSGEFDSIFYGRFGSFDSDLITRLRYGSADGDKYFNIQKTKDTSGASAVAKNIIKLFETNAAGGTELTSLLRLEHDGVRFTSMGYEAFSSFVFVFSSNKDTLENNYGIDDDKMGLLDITSMVKHYDLRTAESTGEDGKTEIISTKTLHIFDSLRRKNLDENGDKIVYIEDNLFFSAVTSYTEAMFYFSFVDVDGTPLAVPYGQSPIVVKTENSVADVTVNGTVSFYVENSDYYKLFASESVKLWSGKANTQTDSNFNIKVVASLIGSDTDGSYTSGFNAKNGNYLSAEIKAYSKYQTGEDGSLVEDENGEYRRGQINEIVLEDGSYYGCQNDAFKITFTYEDSNAASGKGLKAGRYNVYIVCEPQDYTIEFGTRFVDYDTYSSWFGSVDGGSGIDNSAIDLKSLAVENNSDISTTIILESGKTQTATTADATILEAGFGETIEAKSELGSDKGYSFAGWIYVGENGFLHTYGQDTVGRFYLSNDENSNKTVRNVGEDRFKLTAYAVYIRKQVNVFLKNSVVLRNRNGQVGSDGKNSDSVYANANALGVTFSLQVKEGFEDEVVGGVYTYNHSTAVAPSENLQILMGGNNVNGYYLVGFKILDVYGNQIGEEVVMPVENEASLETTNIIGLDISQIQTLLANGSLSATKQTVVLQPIVKQKSLDIAFHSGTGAENIGDGKEGYVYATIDDVEIETTDVVATTEKVYFGETVFSNSKVMTLTANETEYSLTIDKLFASRTGYTRPTSNFWAWGIYANGETANMGTIPYSQLTLNSEYFADVQGIHGAVDFYRLWTPQTYYMTFNANGGKFDDSSTMKNVAVVYDSVATNIPTSIMREGYSLVGWKIQGEEELAFKPDGSFNAAGRGIYLDENGVYVYAGSIQLTAIWVANEYYVEFNFNSGNVGGETSAKVLLTYDENFETVLDGLNRWLTGTVERMGYAFDSFYAVGEGVVQKISQKTTFNKNILTFDFPAAVEGTALTLYAGWNFETTTLQLSLADRFVDNLTYTGVAQEVYLSQYFAPENVTSKGFVVLTDETAPETFEISLPEEMNTIVVISLETTSDAIVKSKSFAVLNSGSYVVTLTLSVLDKATYLNLGEVKRITILLQVEVDKADVSAIENERIDTIAVQNIRRLVTPFVDMATVNKLNSALSLNEAVAVIKNMEGEGNFVNADSSTANSTQIYEYVLVKYYLMITTNNDVEYLTYRAWKYADFLTYKETENNDSETIVQRLRYFSFFDHTLEETVMDFDFYKSGFTLTSENVANVTLSIDKLELHATSTDAFFANGTFELRIYFSESTQLENYDVSTDEDGKAYAVIGTAFLLPEIFTISNASANDEVYYSANYQNRQVTWIGNGSEPVDVFEDGRLFYALDENLYVYADIYTSNAGREETNTEYTFVDAENFLYVDNAYVLKYSDGNYSNVTAQYKLVIDKNEIFTILSTVGVSQITVNAKYLTTRNGAITFEDVDASLVTLSITEVKYIFNGVSKTSNAESDPQLPQTEGVFAESDGTVIYQVVKNNSNQISLYFNSAVQSVTIATSSMKIEGTYAALYKWYEGVYYDVGDDMATSDSLTLTRDEIDARMVEGQVSEIFFNAIFTDLVRVNYDLNLPDGYPSTAIEYANIKLGETTLDTLPIPAENGFGECSSLTVVSGTHEYSIEEMFTGEGNLFVGIGANIYAPITLKAKWTIDLEMQYVQILTDYKTAVSTFENLDVEDVITLVNENDRMFDYTYSWKKLGEDGEYVLLSEERILNLPNKGGESESGTYRLEISAVLKDVFLDSLEDPTQNSSVCEVEFSLEFVKHNLESITLPTETSVVYDNKEHIYGWTVEIAYKIYDAGIQGYSENAQTGVFTFASVGDVSFEVLLDGSQVSSMKNAGTYVVNVLLSEDKFDTSAVDGNLFSFEYEISPRMVDLSTYTFEGAKEFNSADPSLERSILISDGSTTIESLSLILTRQSGEEIGEYELYLDDVNAGFKKNYILTYEMVSLFENGEKTTAASSTKIGTFTITASGILRLSYKESENQPKTYQVGYTGESYNVEITQDFKLVIKKDGIEVKRFDLILFDVSSGYEIESADFLQILQQNNDLSVSFFANQTLTSATNSGIYTYAFLAGEKMSEYYSLVEMSQEFRFEIQAMEVDASKFTWTKDYDGYATLDLDLNGNKVDATTYEGIYVAGTFASYHAGSSLKVDLRLASRGVSLTNYALKSTSSVGTINKLKATMTLAMSETSFDYGEISISDVTELGDVVSISSIVDSNGHQVKDLLMEGYYDLGLSCGAQASQKGYIYKGSYTITPTATFQDFEMTINSLNFEVNAISVEKTIQANSVTITVLDEVQEFYHDTILLSHTGETIGLAYTVSGAAAGTKLAEGNYDFVLSESSFLNGSVNVTINADNNALVVVASASTLYMTIVDSSVLSWQYTGKEYRLSLDTANKKIVVTSESVTVESGLVFYQKNDAGVETSVDASTLSISGNITNGTNVFKNVGKYTLISTITATSFAHVVLAEEYLFEVTPITISVAKVDFSRGYDMTSTITISDFDGKVEGDDVQIFGKFANAEVGKNKNISVYLQGSAIGNYILDSDSAVGEIYQATATISAAKVQYTYGEVSTSNDFAVTVKVGEKEIPNIQYVATVSVTDGVYTDAGFLEVGNYQIFMNATATNYVIATQTATIEIVPYQIAVTFSNDGEITAAYGSNAAKNSVFTHTITSSEHFENVNVHLTREAGSAMGYYHILSGASQNDNYVLSKVEDTSALGAFQVIKPAERVYVLFADGTTETEIYYNGKTYEKISIATDDVGYSLVIANAGDVSVAHRIKLGFFTLSGGEYISCGEDYSVENLTSTLSLESEPEMKSEGIYNILATNTTSDTHEVRMGKNGELYCFTIKVKKKDLFFKETSIIKTFTNKDAIYEIDDANEIVDGLVDGETMSATLEFHSGDSLAKYVGLGYSVKLTLHGDTKDNYNAPTATAGGSAVQGIISRAGVTFKLYSQTISYGQNVEIVYAYETEIADFNLDEYKTSGRQWAVSTTLDGVEDKLSSAGFVNAGEYQVSLSFVSDDFSIVGYIVDNQTQETLNVKVNIIRKQLQIVAKDKELEEVFTKKYDGTDTAEIYENGELLFELDGVVGTDIVSVSSAKYKSEKVENPVAVVFELDGFDAANYVIEGVNYGAIEPYVVDLKFNYDSSITSNVTSSGRVQISQLSYPFTSSTYLTSNSLSDSTASVNNFPTALTGSKGNNFTYWTMNFEADAAQQVFLDAAIIELGLTNVGVGTSYKIRVGNDSKTVAFIGKLLSDTQDLFGTYYQNHDNVTVVFEPNWEGVKCQILVTVADQNGAAAEYGMFSINGGSNLKEYLGFVNYAQPLTITAKPNSHYFYYGFYINGQAVTSNAIEQITSGVNGQMNLAILSVEKDYTVTIRYEVQKVDVVLDVSAYSDVEIGQGNFTDAGDGKYVWATDYISLENIMLSSLPQISRTGYNCTAVTISGSQILTADFEKTDLASFVIDLVNKKVSLNIIPQFEPIGVDVTLDYGYDNLSTELSVVYGSAYNSAIGWVESPTRTGHTFAGWLYDGKTVVGTDLMLIDSEHTLVAQWTINKHKVEITSVYATISESNILFVRDENKYTIASVDYGIQVTFKLTPLEGYEIGSTWIDVFDVTINADGTADVVLTIPDENVRFSVPARAKQNDVTISGEHLEMVIVRNVTDDTEVEFANGSFAIDTGKSVRITVTAATGYDMTTEIAFDNEAGFTVDKTLTPTGELIVTITGINRDVAITFNTEESWNDITIEFSDTTVVERLEVGGTTYNTFDELPTFSALTNSTFTVYVKYVYGYKFASAASDEFTATGTNVEIDANSGFYQIDITDISSNGSVRISSMLEEYEVKVEVVSWDSSLSLVDVPGNKAFVNGMSSVKVPYLTQVEFTMQFADLYNFAGWSYDGDVVFSTDERLTYEVTKSETIYAIFSASKYMITLETLSYYQLYTEYNDEGKVEERYDVISGATYVDGDTGEEITEFGLYYGADKTITVKVPTGYMYYGFGFYDNDGKLVYLDREVKADAEIDLLISSRDFGDNNVSKLCVIMSAYSALVNVQTQIDIDGVLEDDTNVGSIELVRVDGSSVNSYGYVEGTRVHYVQTPTTDKEFDVVAYTGESVYIKVQINRIGYKFVGIKPSDTRVQVANIHSGDYMIYQLSRIEGGIDKVINVDVVFKPLINLIDFSFTNNGAATNGGAFHLTVDSFNTRKVWKSTEYESGMLVSACTDSQFEITAFIRAGYFVEAKDLQLSGNVELLSDITYQSLSVEDTGYTGKITFKVANYMGSNAITIDLKSHTYTVVLKDGATILAKVHNVAYNAKIDLSQANEANIEIFDERLAFVGGVLKVKLEKEKHNFEGYFTFENGAGVQYINSTGEVSKAWQESGYVFDVMTKKYVLTSNTKLDEESGDMEISIYAYLSYLKTKIKFEFVPNIATNYTAQDIVSGVDITNSWYYSASPLYIEVSFNTDIYFTAPEISGFKFYKFVVKQKMADGTWVSDAVAYVDRIPWSTNEFDNFVECTVQIVYFAQVDVRVMGGQGSYTINQADSDTQARALLDESYVDTTKPFIITAQEGKGYRFLRWVNTVNGQSTANKQLTVSTQKKISLLLHLEGKDVKLNFANYVPDRGQILQVQIKTADGKSKNPVLLGRFVGDKFQRIVNEVSVQIGDTVTFVMSVDYGFAVVWNRDDIEFSTYSQGRFYFTLHLGDDIAELTELTTPTVDIIPTFKSDILSIFISRDFVEEEKLEGVVDKNNVDAAGYAVNARGRKMDNTTANYGKDIEITFKTNPRYEIADIVMTNYDKTFTDIKQFLTDGKLILTSVYLAENVIVGNIHLDVTYQRLMWEETNLDEVVLDGEGTERNPYKIFTAKDLTNFMLLINAGAKNEAGTYFKDCSYIVMNNIELDDAFWTPIGSLKYNFDGIFNFNNHSITGIYTTYLYSPTSYGGLFRYVGKNAQIMTSSNSDWYVYLIIGVVALAAIILVAGILIGIKHKKKREELARR
ncbi:MAG: InlB B-repeat-containing protein [Clostridia bacterium]|nr:InlB B-repeat-containing protein [Clostridia bacterium]